MIRGERVVLRGLERDDLPRLWEQVNDLEVESRASDQPPVPTSLAELQARFDARAIDPEKRVVRFVVEADDEIIGECGFHNFDDYARTCHLGISLRREKWGQGYGQDATRTMLDYAFTHLNVRKVYLEVLADDERALGAYRKAGFVEEGRFREHTWHDGMYRDVLRMAVLRSEWTGPAS
jgi:ribosomal-protein-alanine N-acetyltransferase